MKTEGVRRLLLVCATSAESRPLREMLSRVWPSRTERGGITWDAGEMVLRLARTGVAPPDMAERLSRARAWLRNGGRGAGQEREGNSAVIVFGIAGAVGEPSAGHVLLPRSWAGERDEAVLECSPALLEVARAQAASVAPAVVRIGGLGVTVKAPVLTRSERRELASQYPGAVACDMETHTVFRLLSDAGSRLSIRVITDDGASEEPFGAREAGAALPPPEWRVSDRCSLLAAFVYRVVTSLSRNGGWEGA